MRRVRISTVFLLVLCLAGCNALPGIGPNPGPDHPEATETTLGPDDHLAPGLTGVGVTDPEQLTFAHETKLQDESFTHVSSWVLRAENGTVLGEGNQTVAISADGNRSTLVSNASGIRKGGERPMAAAARFSNGSVTYYRYTKPDGETTFHKSSGKRSFRGSFVARDFFATLLNDTKTDVVERVSHDGETLYRVVGRAQSRNATSHFGSGNVSTTNVTVTALVDSSGRIHEFVYEYDYTDDGRTRHWKQTVRYKRVGNTTVERPDWVAEARAATENRTMTGG